MPNGADAVVMIEKTVLSPDERTVRIDCTVAAGQHIERRAAIRRSGDRVLQPPVILGPAAIAAAATSGVNVLSVYRRPEVSVIVTGDELVPPGTPKRAGQIHDSNGPMVTALGKAHVARRVTAQGTFIVERRQVKILLERREVELVCRWLFPFVFLVGLFGLFVDRFRLSAGL